VKTKICTRTPTDSAQHTSTKNMFSEVINVTLQQLHIKCYKVADIIVASSDDKYVITQQFCWKRTFCCI